MAETRWFRQGDMEFEVVVGSAEHKNLVTGGAEPIAAPTGDTPGGLDGMTVKELRARADEVGVDLGDATKKADIVAVLEAADGDESGDEPDDESETLGDGDEA